MYKKIYICSLFLVSAVTCIVFGGIALATYTQNHNDIGRRRFITFRVDSSFSYKEKEAISRALIKWQQASGGYVKLYWYEDDVYLSEIFSWLEDKTPTIYKASSRLSWKRHVSQYVTTSNDVLGAAMYSTGDIFIVDDMPGRFEVVTVHEIGHVLLGSFHSNNTNSVMYPTIGLDYKHRKITEEEIDLLKGKVK